MSIKFPKINYKWVIFALIIGLGLWFIYPRQKSVRKEIKPHQQEIKALQQEIKALRLHISKDSIAIQALRKQIDTIRTKREIIYIQAKKQDAKIQNIIDRPPTDMDDNIKFFAELETKNN